MTASLKLARLMAQHQMPSDNITVERTHFRHWSNGPTFGFHFNNRPAYVLNVRKMAP